MPGLTTVSIDRLPEQKNMPRQNEVEKIKLFRRRLKQETDSAVKKQDCLANDSKYQQLCEKKHLHHQQKHADLGLTNLNWLPRN
jgi:hypothetical protein